MNSNKYFGILFIFLLSSIFSVGLFAQTKLKAVLIVGQQEDGTAKAIQEMNKVVAFLRSKSVEVSTFYDKEAKWEKIAVAAKGANFLIYAGHGNGIGFCLAQHISKEQILKDLKLAPNALVMFQSVCYGAGSSAGDDGDIGLKTAVERVTNYSKTFFELGIACYFAINTSGGALEVLQDLYTNKTVNECFVKSADSFYQIEKAEKAAFDNNLTVSIASSNWGGTSTRTTYTNGVKKVEKIPTAKNYSIAYVSKPDFKLSEIFVK